MNDILSLFYSDVMRRFLRSSSFYRQGEVILNAAQGKSWDDIHSATFILAEREGYLAFLTALRLGILLSAELEELCPPNR